MRMVHVVLLRGGSTPAMSIAAAHCRVASSLTARAAPRKRRWARRATRAIGMGAVIAAAAAVALPPGVRLPIGAPQVLSNSSESSKRSVNSALLTLRLSALLATALHYAETRNRQSVHRDADDTSSSSAFEVPQVVNDAVTVAKQLLELMRSSSEDSVERIGTSSDRGSGSRVSAFQSRVVELLADAVIDASAVRGATADGDGDDGAADALLRVLTDYGLVEALLQHLVRAKPSSEQLVHKIVLAVESLLALATAGASNNTDDSSKCSTSALGVSLETLGAALNHLVAVQALRFTDLLRIGELLCRAQQQQLQSLLAVETPQRQQHFAVARRHSAALAGDAASSGAGFADGLHGFFRLLSPEMPSSIKQFSLWALTSMLHSVEQLPPARQSELIGAFLSPTCAALLLALPHSNEPLQRQAAAFMNVLLHLAPQHAPLAPRATYELWMKQIRFWTSSSARSSLSATATVRTSPALQLESALCLRTLSSHPRGRQFMSESPPTMAALYDLARRLHDSVAVHIAAQTPRVSTVTTTTKKRSGRASRRKAAAPPPLLELRDAVAMQRHVSRAVCNICTSFQNGEAALTSSSAAASQSPSSPRSLLLHSRRQLPMSRVFRGAQDLSDLPVLGAEEYESSTELGWIDILTSWSGSTHREVRLNAIASLVHLAEQSPHLETPAPAIAAVGNSSSKLPATVTQDHILQAWLTSMLQHIRHLSGGGEILAVKQVEEIAQLTDGLTPGNESVQFNPAVVDAGAAALAVLVENHHEELIQQGVVPLMALLSQSRHASGVFDLKTQCARVIANLVASSCVQLEAYAHGRASSDRDGQQQPVVVPADLLPSSDGDDDSISSSAHRSERRREAWQKFVAANFDVQRMLQQTPSGKALLHELQRWGQWDDPMRRSSYFRVVQNMAAYRAFVATGRLEQDLYCEGVHPIVPFVPFNSVDEHDGPDTVAASKVIADASDDDDTATRALEPAIDVVFVHGLRGHPFGTWRTDMGNSLDGKNDIWPDVLLAPDLAREGVRARLVTLGYEAGMVSWSSPWPTLTLQERGKVMLDALYTANIGCSKRAGETPRPVVFVTHSMGGILVKKMLLLAREQAASAQLQLRSQPHEGDLASSTRGAVFLAVPHFGSDLAKGVRSESVRSLIKTHPAIQDLCADHDGRLEELNAAFRALGVDCMSIGEAKPAPLGLGLSAMVVKPESADPGFGSFHVLAGSDHMTICKAKRADEPHYRAILHYVLARAREAASS